MSPRAWRGPGPDWVAGVTRILFDCRYVRFEHHDGISRFTERLVTAIARVHPVVMLISDERQLPMLPPQPWTLGPSPTSIWEPLIAPRAVNRLEADVVFSPMQTMGPFLRRYRLVTTVHDLIYYEHPEPPRNLPALVRLIWRIYHLSVVPQRLLLNRADAQVTISETTKRKMLQLRMTRKPVYVILNGVDHGESDTARQPPAGRDVLYMGSFMPYKNVETLAAAMAHLPGWRLRILSRISASDRKRIQDAAAANGANVEESIEFLNGVSDTEYRAALAEARALATASYDEGFGLPVVEAMVAGTPVAVSDIPIFREVTQGFAEFFDPASPWDAARAIAALGADSHWSHSSELVRRASLRFDWQESGRQLLQVLLKVAGDRRKREYG